MNAFLLILNKRGKKQVAVSASEAEGILLDGWSEMLLSLINSECFFMRENCSTSKPRVKFKKKNFL